MVKETVSALVMELMKDAGPPTIQTVANRLSVQVRTLQRRLEAGGFSYRAVLGDCQRRIALRELSSNDRPVREIAFRLGYSDPAHFVRAFRRWTGYPPIEFRHQAQRARRRSRNG